VSENEYSSLLVVGGGIAGLTVAVEAAELGREVYLIEEQPFLGGRVSRMNQYFPKLCPPSCGLEINFRRIKQNNNIRVFTSTTVQAVAGESGSFEVTLKSAPAYVNDKCTACGDCAEACEVEIDNPFNLGMDKTKAFHLPYSMAYPLRYAVDRGALTDEQYAKCREACKYDAIEESAEEKTFNLKVGSVVLATGWKPYDAANLENLGYGKFKDVITNVQMERLASKNGPTGGKIVRPSNGEEIKSVAFVQCAGSRDKNHLPYCSGVCCLASLKQATYIREQYPDAEIGVFFIDMRTSGRLEDFMEKVKADEKVYLTKGKAADVKQDDSGKLTVRSEGTLTKKIPVDQFDLVVLATGMVPNDPGITFAGEVAKDEWGFFVPNAETGIVSAGCAKHPVDVSTAVQDGTGAALKAIIRG
jgi:quinone-modifying oxidoreductase, subunit QmoA